MNVRLANEKQWYTGTPFLLWRQI